MNPPSIYQIWKKLFSISKVKFSYYFSLHLLLQNPKYFRLIIFLLQMRYIDQQYMYIYIYIYWI